jgi:hypothetical protein
MRAWWTAVACGLAVVTLAGQSTPATSIGFVVASSHDGAALEVETATFSRATAQTIRLRAVNTFGASAWSSAVAAPAVPAGSPPGAYTITLARPVAAPPGPPPMATLGITGTGGNTRSINGIYRGSPLLTMPANSTSYTVRGYIEDSAAGDSFRAIIVADDETTIVAYSDVRTNISTVGEYTFSGGTFASVQLNSGTSYYFLIGSNSAANAFSRYGDTPTIGSALATVNNITATPPTMTGAVTLDATRDIIVWLDYTAAGGRTALNTRSHPLGLEIGTRWRLQ